jgi:hypothetical protein
MEKLDRNIRILFAVAVISGLYICWFSIGVHADIEASNLKLSRVAAIRKNLAGEAILSIDFGNEDIKRFSKRISNSMTAFDLLAEGALALDLSLDTKQYDFGILVEAIDGIENGQNNSYWLYYVNDQAPNVASDKQTIEEGDRVEFRFEASIY